MTHKETSGIGDKLERKLIDGIIKTLFKDGYLTLEDFDNEAQFRKKISAFNKKADYKLIIDHSRELISTARDFVKKEHFDNAKLFYATYFEHELNGIIKELCTRKGIEKKIINDIIKNVNLIGKLTWLPLILGSPLVTEAHKNVILKLADDRNAYVHYKHNPQPDEPSKDSDQKAIDELKKIERTVIYFKKYVSRVLYNRKKTHLDNKLKKRALLRKTVKS